MMENLIEKSLVSKDVINAYMEIKQAPVSHENSGVDLDDYGEFDALDEILVGM